MLLNCKFIILVLATCETSFALLQEKESPSSNTEILQTFPTNIDLCRNMSQPGVVLKHIHTNSISFLKSRLVGISQFVRTGHLHFLKYHELTPAMIIKKGIQISIIIIKMHSIHIFTCQQQLPPDKEKQAQQPLVYGAIQCCNGA